ncbi:TonB-dependent receptor [Sphingomonas naphthae]|uniref:TonB-dependent receptor n=1 Tax=Sphingomonas naphthae TaxID=1813468 RepID=A0ABY7TLX6_9SPHN|nr:TonB-dependent receptor [Sphingomonas naphthae]WCT74164.1 TonB-dependent receptor [Sphingomonas naphthae]
MSRKIVSPPWINGLGFAVVLATAGSAGAEPAPAPTPAPAPAAPAEEQSDTIVVTGTRGSGRIVADSPVPINVLSADQLARAGGANTALKDALESLAPSFVVNTRGNATWGTVSKPAGLRGLSGAHVLVLVDGKRRHNSALPFSAADSQAIGANSVDLDLIPMSAIDHIEILRDGAAAQYGSDAIAGVINIILKSSAKGGSLGLTLGQRYKFEGRQDGETVYASGNIGLPVGGTGGFLNLSFDVKKQDWTLRVNPSTQTFFFPVNGQPDPREATIDKRVFRGGTPKIKAFNLFANAALPLSETVTAYATGSFGQRDGELGQSHRLANTVNVIPQLLPASGVLQPTTQLKEEDYQLTAGIKGELGRGSWDLSSTYGRNRVNLFENNSVNPSLGLSSPSDFQTFTPIFTQWTNNLDFTQPVDVGLAEPLQISLGLEHRYERFQVKIGDPLAFANGGYIFPSGPLAGQAASIGAQAAVLVLPEDAADLKRDNFAGYVDLGAQVTPNWYVAVAGRYEHYTDSAGDTWSGKLTSRYDLTPTLAVRGTVSNGFRAPSLSQTGFATGSQTPAIVNGQIAGITSQRNAKPDSPLGLALGATPLKPEKSFNLSGGISFQPGRNFTLDIDAYQIDLDDRIARTTTFRGTGIAAILRANGFDPNQAVSYNTNAIDTRTRGLDVVAAYTLRLADSGLGTIRWNLGFNYNKTTIRKIKDTPAQLSAIGLTLFDRVAQSNYTVSLPRTKLILGADWNIKRFDLSFKSTRYGGVQLLTDNAASDQKYGAKWISDVEIGYRLTEQFTLAIGANNVFDVYPDRSTVPDVIGSQRYANNSPFGYFGGFYYARAGLKF